MSDAYGAKFWSSEADMTGFEHSMKLSDDASPRPHVESARKLSARSVACRLVQRSGSFVLRLRDPTTGAVDYELRVSFAVDGDKAGLRLSCDPDRLIRMQALQQPRGGRRWIFVDHAGVRRTALYQPAGESRFASRETWGLSYASQSTGRRRRAEQKATRIHRKFGGSGDLAAAFPPKPPRMHTRTYAERRAQAEAAAAVALTGRALASSSLPPSAR